MVFKKYNSMDKKERVSFSANSYLSFELVVLTVS